MKTQTDRSPITVTITIPGAFAAKLRGLLAQLGYPESYIRDFAREGLVNDSTLDIGNWLGAYQYPNRSAAERVAARLLADRSWHSALYSQNVDFGGLPYATAQGVRYLRVNVPTPDWAKDHEAVAAAGR